MKKEKLDLILEEVRKSFESINETWPEGHVPLSQSPNDYLPCFLILLSSLGTGWERSEDEITSDFRRSMIRVAALCIEAANWCDRKNSEEN